MKLMVLPRAERSTTESRYARAPLRVL